ncbi:hypothetical protein ACFR97_14420 [Haloplanus litoreus]|uniref:Uncharacterized protein n=1 Tax=Haloplanus litoreus TaxID=767515 RepID=A0ABD5ZYN5_9EURY
MVDRSENTDDARVDFRVVEAAESWISGLDVFLFDNRHLFTLIGVFGAFSIYLREADLPATGPDEVPLANLVSFFGFGIVLLLFLLILIKLYSKMLSPDEGDLLLRPENVPYLVFFLFLLPIILTLMHYLSTFPASAAAFWFSFVYLLAPLTVFWAHDRLISEIEIHAKLADILGRSRYTGLALLSLVTALAGLLVYTIIETVYGPNTFQALIAGARPSQRWLLFIAIFIAIWFYAATAGLFLTVIQAVWAGLSSWFPDNSSDDNSETESEAD